jgi:hypothetical protein
MKGAELYRWFWKTMAERIGPRWYDDRGLYATDEWKRLLDQYPHEHIQAALDTNPVWDYPPTHGRVAKLLAEMKLRLQGQAAEDQRRAVWRSAICADIIGTGALVKLWSFGTRVDQIPPDLLRQIIPVANDLCEEMLQWEKRQEGRISSDMYPHVSSEVFRFLARLKERESIQRAAAQ